MIPTRDPYAVALGLQFGRYAVSDPNVRSALREHVLGRRRSTRTDVRSLRMRASTSGEQGVLVGIASRPGVAYRIGPNVKEVIAPGAWEASLRAQGGVVPVFYEHNWNEPLGVARASETAEGLRVEVRAFIEDSERARMVWKAAQAGALREFSVGFLADAVTVTERNGVKIETITAATLLEVSVVVRGAARYDDGSPATKMVSVRNYMKEVA